ncbi:MAG: guanylate kinase [Oligoflexales bacterium]|nr:guanylate kinase [Oligoflexales bacterium]
MGKIDTNKIIVISAPSGAGKTTLNFRLMKECPDIELTVSHTTRSPRTGETQGVHYYFVSQDEFRALIGKDAFLEWAEVHGNLYGTSKSELERIHADSKIPMLEIDVQGWKKAKPLIPDATSIFILPPSLETLWKRLEGRGSDSFSTRWQRFLNAYQEIASIELYDNFIINDDLEEAYSSLKAIVSGASSKKITKKECLIFCEKLKQEFHEASWIKEVKGRL